MENSLQYASQVRAITCLPPTHRRPADGVHVLPSAPNSLELIAMEDLPESDSNRPDLTLSLNRRATNYSN
jgi:hypothetical protein